MKDVIKMVTKQKDYNIVFMYKESINNKSLFIIENFILKFLRVNFKNSNITREFTINACNS